MSDDAANPRGLEGVRRRPGMYVGGNGTEGLHHLLWEVVGNVVDLHLIGAATELDVTLADDGWIGVRDDGPGLSVEPARGASKSMLEQVLTELHVTPTYDDHLPHIHVAAGLRGVGLACVNALSTHVEVETIRGGQRWQQHFQDQRPTSAPRALGPATTEGTTVRFRPDPAIFETVTFAPELIARRLQEIAWLNPMLRVSFQGRRLRGFRGTRGWVSQLAGSPTAFAARYCVGGVSAEVAIAWQAEPAKPIIHSFVNMQRTHSGTHYHGLWLGLAQAMKRYERSVPGVRAALAPGLIAALHVGLYHPKFGGPSRDHLESPVAAVAVSRAIAADMPGALSHDLGLRQLLCARLGIAAEPASRWALEA